MKASFKIEGMDKLIKDIETLGKLPQKHVTAAARKGMGTVLRDAKGSAPFETGQLKSGMVLKGERASHKGKKVYEVIFNPAMNNVFQKTGKDGKVNGYYPVSQEYGFFAKNGRFIPGYRFIHDSLNENAESVGKVMIESMKTKIDAEIRKAGL